MEGEGENTLFIKDDTGEFKEYTPPSFVESIPEDLREHFEGVEDVGTLAKQHVELKQSLPTVPEEYEIKFPDDFQFDEAVLDEFKGLAKELKLPQETVDKFIEFDINRAAKFNEMVQEMVAKEEKAAAEAKEAAVNSLKDLWGAKYEPNKEVASAGFRAVLSSFGDEAEDIEKSLGDFTDNPYFLRLFHKIGEVVSEDVFIKPDRQPAKEHTLPDGTPSLTYPNSPELRR
jgi:hypothetical protein